MTVGRVSCNTIAAASGDAAFPLPTLPRKRGREQKASRDEREATFTMSVSQCSQWHGLGLPLPLAGEGGEGALAARDDGEVYTMTGDAREPNWRVSRKLRGRAKALRQDMTDAERIVWHAVRAHRVNGAAFRRQAPIGPYVVDFVCHTAKLVIEVDGGQHFEPSEVARDNRRRGYFARQGYCVLRFNNLDVIKNKSGVLETIAAAIGNAAFPLPDPPPQAGEGADGRAR
jgi:very-short-patch-repair endonuclease